MDNKIISSNCGIYAIRNLINGKQYIGSSVNIYARWNKHKSQLNCKEHPNSKLQNSWNKYGENYFLFKILLVCKRDNLILYEQRAIDIFDSVNIGFNIRFKAESNLGLKASNETKEKLRTLSSGRIASPETKAKMAIAAIGNKKALGAIRSIETRAKMSASKIGIKKSANHIENMRNSQLGKKLSIETKKRISDSNIGRIVSDETRIKISTANIGKKMSVEFREKMRVIASKRIGKKRSIETKNKMIEAWKIRKALKEICN